MTAPDRLYDQLQGREVTVSFPGVTNLDIVEFCKYFGVAFCSLTSPIHQLKDFTSADIWRAATEEYPSRGLDLTYKSVLSWRRAQKMMGEEVLTGGIYEIPKIGQVTTVVGATGPRGGSPIVVYVDADGNTKYMPSATFFGISFDKETDEYRPNSILLRKAA